MNGTAQEIGQIRLADHRIGDGDRDSFIGLLCIIHFLIAGRIVIVTGGDGRRRVSCCKNGKSFRSRIFCAGDPGSFPICTARQSCFPARRMSRRQDQFPASHKKNTCYEKGHAADKPPSLSVQGIMDTLPYFF